MTTDPTTALRFAGYAAAFRDPRSGVPTPVLDDIDISFRRGALTAVVGETGSGKTMLALAVLGLSPRTYHRTTGSIWFDGEDLATYTPARLRRIRGTRIAMVFQDSRSALNPVFTIGRQLTDVLRLHHGIRRGEARERAVELLSRVRVPEPARRLRQYPHELSGGTLQRVQLAIALACEPELLLLDEPTTGLDLTIQAEVLELVVELVREQGMSAILITHDMGVVAQTCDDVVVLRHGRVCESGATDVVLTTPEHPYTAELVAASRTGETHHG